MKDLINYINEAAVGKIKDEYSTVKKICGKAKFFWDPSQWSTAFRWKDDDYILIQRPRGLRSTTFRLDSDFDGDPNKALEEIFKIFEDKDSFLKVNCRHYLDEDVDNLDIKKYIIARVRPEQMYAVVQIMKNGNASVYGNKDEKWTLDNFDLDEETFAMYKEMRKKTLDKFFKEQEKRFTKKDKGFTVVLFCGKKFLEFTFEWCTASYKENIPLSNKAEIIEKIKAAM